MSANLRALCQQAKTFFSVLLMYLFTWSERGFKLLERNSWGKGEASSWVEAFPYGDGLITDEKLEGNFSGLSV